MEGETEVFFLKQLEVTIPLFFLYGLILFNPTNEHANHKQQWMYQHSPKQVIQCKSYANETTLLKHDI